MTILLINGTKRATDVDPDTPLLWVLRDELGLTGTKFGCGMALCGACKVHLDGQPTPSCITPLSAVGQQAVTTIEGVTQQRGKAGKVAKAVQDAWIALDVAQCGYCQSGQIMSAIGLLSHKPAPSDADIDGAMSGNICRCATYVRIRAAIKQAAQALKA
jgi:isoquinoline 1-oxidoreductase alpha subunit